ncbi:MAG: glycosyltransferase family 2 protein [Ginsengibacter sp.]
MQLSVIIVNYNVKYFLEQCLLSVEKALKNIDSEIIVIDNNSEDGSFYFFKNRFPKVTFRWNKINSGFAKANNQALEIAKGEYVLFLNPDTILPEDCLEKSIAFVQSKNNEIALGIKMLDGSGKFLKESKRAFPSPSTSFYKLSGLSKLFPQSKTFAKYHLGNLNENKNHEVDVLAGAFMLVPKKILEKTGGFDEQFFMYGEDIDLSYRILEAGFANYYFAESAIIHFKGESTRKGSLNYVIMFYNAMSIFVKKHFGENKAALYIFCLETAIFFRGSLSAISRVGKKVYNKKRKGSIKKKKVVVAGDEIEFENVKYLLELAAPHKLVAGRIEPGNNFTKNSIASFAGLRNVFSFSGANEIIFCEGRLSFQQIISAMPKVPDDVAIKIFAKSSHAIIGSDDKNVTGDIILKKED